MSDERPTPFTGSVADILSFVRDHGRLPFPISGGSQDADGDGDGDGDGAGGDGDGDGETPESKLKATLDKVRGEKKTADAELKKAQKRIQELENAGKPEADQAKQAAKDAEEARDAALDKLREKSGRAAVIDAAVKAQSPKPDVVYRLLKGDLAFDDDGEPTNVDELLKKAQEDAPELFKPQKNRGNGDGGNRDSKDPPAATPGLGRLRAAYGAKDT